MEGKLNIEKIIEPNVFKIHIDGTMKSNVAIELFEHFQYLPSDSKVKFLTIMDNFDGFKSLKEFIQGVSSQGLNIKRLEKNALLCNSRWLEQVIKLDDGLKGITNYKFFKLSEEKEAIKWLIS